MDITSKYENVLSRIFSINFLQTKPYVLCFIKKGFTKGGLL